MKGFKFPNLLLALIASFVLLFPQSHHASGGESSLFNNTNTISASGTIADTDEGLVDPITDWFGSLRENIDSTIEDTKEKFDRIASYIGELFGTVNDSISVFTGEGDATKEITDLNHTIDQVEKNLGDIGIDLGENKVYRVLREDEDPNKGIFAKAPEREHITIAGHVNNGGKRTFKGSKYISTTKSLKVALENATKDIMNAGKAHDLRIIQIDLHKVPNKYYDLTDPDVQDKYLVNSKGEPWEKVRRYANKSQELLIEYSVPPEAIKLLGRPSALMN